MTSLAAALGMLPLAWGVGSADMLRPLAIAVIGAVCVSVLLSLVATPVLYSLMREPWRGEPDQPTQSFAPIPEPSPAPMPEPVPERRKIEPESPSQLPDWQSFGPR
jgi:hypothetical protein